MLIGRWIAWQSNASNLFESRLSTVSNAVMLLKAAKHLARPCRVEVRAETRAEGAIAEAEAWQKRVDALINGDAKGDPTAVQVRGCGTPCHRGCAGAVAPLLVPRG